MWFGADKLRTGQFRYYCGFVCWGKFARPIALWATALCLGNVAHAGGGAENILLVVNSDSESSKTIANHYIRGRQIPASHVLYLHWKWNRESTTGDLFREHILNPTLQAIIDRRLGLQIDYIVYSSDFPWRVDFRPDFPGKKFPRDRIPMASLTGATYLWQFSRQKSPSISALYTNWYVAGDMKLNLLMCQAMGPISSRGIRANYAWQAGGRRTGDLKDGFRYMPSMMLGVTSGRGNSVEEVLSYLRRAVAADVTHPQGTFYFVKNDGIRSTTRHNCYDEVVMRLRKLGVGAQVIEGDIPQDRADVLGVMAGVMGFNLGRANCTFLPGAICDNLTSSGGVLSKGASQTPLTDFLMHGAAMSSGTVYEPIARQAKFPLATMPFHYVNGCCAAEALYQSVAAPYQLLSIGDPLCQPWAAPPIIAVEGIERGARVTGTVTISPLAEMVANRRVRHFEVHVDGQMQSRFTPGKSYELDTLRLSDGHHLLTVVGVDAHPVEAQGRLQIPFEVGNGGNNDLDLAVVPVEGEASSDRVTLSAQQSGAKAIEFFQNSRRIGRVDGERGEVRIERASLGRGPVRVQAKSEGAHPVSSREIWLHNP